MSELKSKDIEKEIGKSMKKTEIFGKIISNLSRYVICSNGDIISMNYHNQRKIRILKQQKDRYGYNYIKLFDDSKKPKKMKVHRLVALAFLPNKGNRDQVNHLDGDKSNNNAENLEWSTHQENMNHAKDSNLINSPKGSRCGASRLKEGQIFIIREMLSEGVTQKEVARRFGVSRDAIGKIKRRETWGHLNDRKKIY